MTVEKIVNLLVITVDDDPKHRETILKYCKQIEGDINSDYKQKGVQIILTPKEFDALEPFLEFLKENTIHILVMDLKFGAMPDDRSGWKGIDAIMSLEIVPSLIYSGFVAEEPAERFKNIFIAMVSKGDANIGVLLKKMILIKLRLMLEKERILNEFHGLSLDTFHTFFDPNDLENISEKVLSDITVNRLRTLLANYPLLQEGGFAQESIFLPPSKDRIYPSLMLGDIIRDCANRFFIVMSPSCDLVFEGDRKTKIQTVLLLPCFTSSENMRQLKGLKTGKKDELMDGYIKRGIVKVQKCPKKLFSAEFILFSFKDYFTLPYSVLMKDFLDGKISIVSTLSTPYAESLQNLFIRDFSRIGTPDTIDIDKEIKEGKKFIRQIFK